MHVYSTFIYERVSNCYLPFMDFSVMGIFSCRRNCKGNPNCLVGIGEQVWLGEIDENTFHNIDDPNSERREKVFLTTIRFADIYSAVV